MEWPGRIESVEEVDIETTRGPGAPVHRTIIWAVIGDGDSPYLDTMIRDEIAPTTIRLEPR